MPAEVMNYEIININQYVVRVKLLIKFYRICNLSSY